MALCADYLVLHPGSYRGMSRKEGLQRAAAAIDVATQGLHLKEGGLTILIENTAGAEFSLGGSFEQVSELLHYLREIIPVSACLDTCHTHVAGYDIVSESGYRETVKEIDSTIGISNVRVWHCNDAKAGRGSKLDRHQHIGQGAIGLEAFRRLLNEPQFKHSAFIAETPIDEPGDDLRNIETLKSLVKK
jgi:deoxyribonuclease IV